MKHKMKELLLNSENRVAKRLFDLTMSLLVLLTIFPPLLLIVALVTKISSPGPVFFIQKRHGMRGEEFDCYKFRTMYLNEQSDCQQATQNDPRITRFGNFMRRTSIDEFPQFINVLKGNMSIVGPRPHMLLHTEQYAKLTDSYMARHFVKPGITGWAQVSGYRGEIRELEDLRGRVRCDIWYIHNWSFRLDLKIIWRTVAVVFMGDKKAY